MSEWFHALCITPRQPGTANVLGCPGYQGNVSHPSNACPHPSLVWQFITEGYAAHLAQLEYNHRARPAKNTTRMALRKGSFGLPGQTEFLRKRNHLLRTISSQPSATGAGHRPERTQSQSDSEKERDRERSQRSMSIATGCWGRSAASRLESGLLGQK